MNSVIIERWEIFREQVEQQVGRRLRDDEWMEFADEIKGRIDNYCDELYNDLIDQLGKDVFKPKTAKPKPLDEEIW